MSGAQMLVELVGRHTRVTRAGRHWKACCPFHDEKTPSFQIFDDGHFHCFGCQAHGDAIGFVMQSEGVGFLEACDRLGIEPPGGRRSARRGPPPAEPPPLEQEPDEPEVVTPFYEPPKFDLDEAQAILAERARRFFDNAVRRAPDETPEHVGMKATVGAGKTTSLRGPMREYIETAKANNLPHRVAVAVKQLTLADQTKADMRADGIEAKVYRGRAADDPDQPGKKMCHDLDAVQAAQDMGESVSRMVCGTANGLQCPFFTVCGYQRQMAEVAAADVPIMAHEGLTEGMPDAVKHDIGVVHVDEDFWQTTLKSARTFVTATLHETPGVFPVLFTNGQTDLDSTDDLITFWARVGRARESMPGDGFALRSAFLSAGVTAEAAFRAGKLEWRRRRDGLLRPGMTKEQRQKAAQEARGNRGIPSRAELAKAIGRLIEGTAEQTGTIECVVTDEGHRAFVLRTRKPIADWIQSVPVMHTSATMRPALVRHVLDNFRMVADLRVKAPHQKCVVVEGGFGKASMVNAPGELAGNLARDKKRTEIHDFIAALAAGLPSHVTVHQAVEDHFADIDACETSHLNAAHGLNDFADVAVEVIIGPSRPAPATLRSIAITLTGEPIPKQRVQRTKRAVTMRDGSGRAIDTLIYEHPVLQDVYEGITGANFEQAIRCRGVRRTAEDPVLLVLMGNHVLPLEVDMVLPWKAVRPNVRDKMLARGAEIESPTYAARVYPDLFVDRHGSLGSVPSARFALASYPRPGTSQIDAIRNLIGITARNIFVEAEFRPVGVGLGMSNVRLPASRSLHDFRIDMEAIFGTEVVVELLEPPLWQPSPTATKDWRTLHFGDLASFGTMSADSEHVPRAPPDG